MKKKILPLTVIILLFLTVILLWSRVWQAGRHDPAAPLRQTPFFFAQGTDAVRYHALFTFPGENLPEEVEVRIEKAAEGKNGIFYEIRIDCDGDFAGRYLDGYDRFRLGCFYVTEDKIRLIREQNTADAIRNEESLNDTGCVVCQETEKKDQMEGKKGWHESITVNGDICEYRSYNDLTETGYYEGFLWEKGKGMLEYRSGFGAEMDGIELQIK